MNFWMAALRYQIDHELTDKALSRAMNIDHKTVAAWRECIPAGAAAQGVLDYLASKYGSAVPPQLVELRKAVRRLQRTLKRRRSDAVVGLTGAAKGRRRSDAGLPRPEKFEKVVQHCATTIIKHHVDNIKAAAVRNRVKLIKAQAGKKSAGRLGEPKQLAAGGPMPDEGDPFAGLASVEAAEAVAAALARAYAHPYVDHSTDFRHALESRLSDVAMTATRISLMQALAFFPSRRGVDSRDEAALSLLEAGLAKQIEAAQNTNEVYARALDADVRRSEQWWADAGMTIVNLPTDEAELRQYSDARQARAVAVIRQFANLATANRASAHAASSAAKGKLSARSRRS